MQLRSPAFADTEAIPKKYTEDGENASPPLHWSDLPEGTRELALIMEDPDAPQSEPWVHWLLYHVTPTMDTLPERLPRNAVVDIGPLHALQGLTSWGPGSVGYRGPAPPPGHGRHRYYFHLYALDRPLHLGERIEKDALLAAIARARVLGEATLIGTYER